MLPELIQTQESLARLVEDLGRQPRLAVDTESNSLHAYRERVCLIQFSIPGRDIIVDPLALEHVGSLGAVFSDPGIEKVFHAAEYDILCLRRDFGFEFSSIFDTMQAGRILGRKMAGLDRLLEEKFGVKVSKRLQKADWGVRPLSRESLEYAAQDTHYLIPLRDMLEIDLRERGLLELAQEDFRMACNSRNHLGGTETASPAWVRFGARRDLAPQDLAVLKELSDWRESTAERLDRPPFKVMSDERLIEIARAKPTSMDALAAAGVAERQVHQWGTGLIQAVERGLQSPPLHRARPQTPSAAFLKRLELLKEWRKKEAAGMDVESDVVLPRALLLALADRGPQDLEIVMQPSPWRLKRFGAQIVTVLQRVPAG